LDLDVVRQTIQTYDKIASEYCKKTRQVQFLEWEENYIRKLLFFIPKPNPLILDVGCGDGRHTILIERNGARAIGIDLSKNMLAEAKTLYPDGDFRRMDMRRLLFNDKSFDGIWASGSIYHATKLDARKVIKEFRRVLTMSGVVAVSFKLGRGEGMEANPKSYSGSPRYFAYYTRDEMKDLFSSFGFAELESCTYPEEIFGDNIQQMWFQRSV
jgi:ubiquinone/menaquinone biosynthesis C-methylase UbiE